MFSPLLDRPSSSYAGRWLRFQCSVGVFAPSTICCCNLVASQTMVKTREKSSRCVARGVHVIPGAIEGSFVKAWQERAHKRVYCCPSCPANHDRSTSVSSATCRVPESFVLDASLALLSAEAQGFLSGLHLQLCAMMHKNTISQSSRRPSLWRLCVNPTTAPTCHSASQPD